MNSSKRIYIQRIYIYRRHVLCSLCGILKSTRPEIPNENPSYYFDILCYFLIHLYSTIEQNYFTDQELTRNTDVAIIKVGCIVVD